MFLRYNFGFFFFISYVSIKK